MPEFVDAAAVDIHPDELDAYNDDNMDGDSQDGNDDLNRLRDMMDQESDCESEEGYSSVQFLDDKEKEVSAILKNMRYTSENDCLKYFRTLIIRRTILKHLQSGHGVSVTVIRGWNWSPVFSRR